MNNQANTDAVTSLDTAFTQQESEVTPENRAQEEQNIELVSEQQAVKYVNKITSIHISSNNELLAAGNDDSVRIWSLADGKLQHTFPSADTVNSVYFSQNNQLLAASYECGPIDIEIWSLDTYHSLQRLGDGGRINCLCISPNNSFLAAGSRDNEGEVKVWSLKTGTLKTTLSCSDNVTQVHVSPNSKLLVAGCQNGATYIYSLGGGTLKHYIEPLGASVSSFSISPNHTLMAAGYYDFGLSGMYRGAKSVKIWSLSTGNLEKKLKGHTQSVMGVQFASGGKNLLSISQDKSLRLWNVQNGDCLWNLKICTIDIARAIFSANSKYLAITTDDEKNTLCVYRLNLLGKGLKSQLVWLSSSSSDEDLQNGTAMLSLQNEKAELSFSKGQPETHITSSTLNPHMVSPEKMVGMGNSIKKEAKIKQTKPSNNSQGFFSKKVSKPTTSKTEKTSSDCLVM